MESDERYGRVYGAALARVIEEVCEWMEAVERPPPASLDMAFSYVERVARKCPQPSLAWRRVALAECTVRPGLIHALAEELARRGRFTHAERLALAVEHLEPEERGLQSSFIRGQGGRRREALDELSGIARDGSRTETVRLAALLCLGDLDAPEVALRTAIAMLEATPVDQRRFVSSVGGALQLSFGPGPLPELLSPDADVESDPAVPALWN